MSVLGGYVAAALIESALRNGENGTWRGDASKLAGFATNSCNFDISEQQAAEALAILVESGIAAITDDPYAGEFYRITGHYLQSMVNRADDQRREYERWEGSGQDPDLFFEDGQNRELRFLLNHPEIQKYHDFGSEWLNRALATLQLRLESGEIAEEIGLGDSVEAIVIPASDRLVTLGHNQRAELETSADDVIKQLEKENAIDGETETRSWMLGQLKAGRELIRAGSLHVLLLKATILSVLNELIEKYKGHAIGAAATVLLELLFKHIFGAS